MKMRNIDNVIRGEQREHWYGSKKDSQFSHIVLEKPEGKLLLMNDQNQLMMKNIINLK